MAPARTAYSGPEMTMHPLDKLVPEPPGKVQVDIREHGHVVGYEALESEVPRKGVDVADTDKVSDEQRNGGAASSSGGSLLHRGFRSYQTPLLHDPLRYEHYISVEQQKARQTRESLSA